MSEYAEAIMRLEISGSSERRDEDVRYYSVNHTGEMKRDRKKWGKILEEEQHTKLQKFNIPQLLKFYPNHSLQDFHDGKFRFKFNTDFTLAMAPIKAISVGEIKLQTRKIDTEDVKCSPFMYLKTHHKEVILDTRPEINKKPNPNYMKYVDKNKTVIDDHMKYLNITKYGGGKPDNFKLEEKAFDLKLIETTNTLTAFTSYDFYYFAKLIEDAIRNSYPNDDMKFCFEYNENRNIFVFRVFLHGNYWFEADDYFFINFKEKDFHKHLGWTSTYDIYKENVIQKKNYKAEFQPDLGDTMLSFWIDNPTYDYREIQVCASFSLWEPNQRIGRNHETHDQLNQIYPYTRTEDFEVWFITPQGNIIKDPKLWGEIVLQLHMEKKV